MTNHNSPLPNINPTTTSAWQSLSTHYQQSKDSSMQELFEQNPDRASQYRILWEDFYIDYSKNILSDTCRTLLLNLAEECKLKQAIDAYFKGEPINQTEGRAVLHTALRDSGAQPIMVAGSDVTKDIKAVKQKMKSFADEVISGKRKGHTGKAFTDVVNIGIGGSDLGPAMVVDALQYYRNHLNVHFVSNVDGDHVAEVIKKLNPETTLFVIVSKTFTTQETISNANTIKKWFLQHAKPQDIATHFVAVSTNLEGVESFGISADNVFPMWDWVGGRFSLWSAVGLSVILAVGYDHFEQLLEGANEMDNHFRETPFEQNIPVMLALISIWYNNFYNAESEAIVPYCQYLNQFVAYLQQGIMESNGKSVDRNGQPIDYQTGTIIWGEPGTNSQHAFFQLIHQGTKLIPTDFIGFQKSLHGNTDHHDKLMSNFFAQTEALLHGKNAEEVKIELKYKLTEQEIEQLFPFKVFEGNKPTNTILINQLTPNSLGKLIAMYEHKIFVQGIIWNIYSYDQWGVELGKQLASNILTEITGTLTHRHDSSTNELLNYYKNK